MVVVGRQVVRRLAQGAQQLRPCHMRDQAAADALRDLVLQREHLFAATIVVFGPQLVAGACINEMGRDSQALWVGADAAFEQVAHPEFAPDGLGIDLVGLVCKRGMACDHRQVGHRRKQSD